MSGQNGDGRPRCPHPNKQGGPCGSPPGANGYCWTHSPDVPEEVKRGKWEEGLKNAAHPKVLPPNTPTPAIHTPAQAVAVIEDTVGQVRRGELSVNVANSISYAVSVAVRAMDLAIDDRLDKLERLLKRTQLRA